MNQEALHICTVFTIRSVKNTVIITFGIISMMYSIIYQSLQ